MESRRVCGEEDEDENEEEEWCKPLACGGWAWATGPVAPRWENENEDEDEEAGFSGHFFAGADVDPAD
jgi:hypothetical protein